MLNKNTLQHLKDVQSLLYAAMHVSQDKSIASAIEKEYTLVSRTIIKDLKGRINARKAQKTNNQ